MDTIQQEISSYIEEELQVVTTMLVEQFEERLAKLDEVCVRTVKEMTSASRFFALEELRELTELQGKRIQQATDRFIERLDRSSRWFSWQRVMTIILTVLLSSGIFSLLVHDQWPWETHQQVATERGAGQAFMKAWPSLSEEEKAIFQRALSEVI